MAISFTVYPGTDNVEEIVIVEEGAVIDDLSGVTSVQVVVNGEVVDSDTAPANTIWWTDTKVITAAMAADDDSGVLADYVGDTVDVLKLRLGNSDTVNALSAGTYKNCCILLFDVTNTDGVVWDSTVKIKIKACATV
jgi:hypothetical protein